MCGRSRDLITHLEQFDPYAREDDEKEGDEEADGGEGRQCREYRVDEHWHAGDALECAERTEGAHGADGTHVALTRGTGWGDTRKHGVW